MYENPSCPKIGNFLKAKFTSKYTRNRIFLLNSTEINDSYENVQIKKETVKSART